MGVVAVTAILAKIFLFGNKKKTKSPITLQDPNTKYPLKLVDKEVQFFNNTEGSTWSDSG